MSDPATDSIPAMAARILDRLNGWQRLWLVVAVIWLPMSAWVVADDFPTDADRPSYAKALVEQQKLIELAQSRMLGAPLVLSEKEKWARAAEWNRQIDRDILDAQLIAAGKGLALWIGPMMALYLLGMAVAWIRTGFRSNT